MHAQWIQTNAPCGGFVYAPTVSGMNPFAGADGCGVFPSTKIPIILDTDIGTDVDDVLALTDLDGSVFKRLFAERVFGVTLR
jgi:hypothetical protein